MLKRNKTIALVVAFVFCMTFLAPAFIAPNVAKAGSSYEVLTSPTVKTIAGAADLGVIEVTLDSTAIAAYSRVTVSLPSDLRFTANGDTRTVNRFCGAVNVVNTTPAPGAGITIVAPGLTDPDALQPADFCDNSPIPGINFNINPNNTFDIQLQNPMTTTGADKYFYIYFYGVDLNNISGDIDVNFIAPTGSAFTSSAMVVIGKTTSSGSTSVNCKKVVNLTDAGGTLDIISILENSGNTLTAGQDINLEIMTKGFTFDALAATDAASYGWAFGNNAVVAGDMVPLGPGNFNAADDEMSFTLGAVGGINDPGRISFANLAIEVDETKVDPGDILEIKISGGDITKQTVEVAKYVDYDVTVEEGTVETIVAGLAQQEVGEFYIKEGARRSLVQGRVVKFTLPSGCSWNAANTGDTELMNSSNLAFNGAGYPALTGDNNEILKWNINAESTNEGAEVKLKDFEIDVAPDFRGDLEIEISGSAGAVGTIKVAEVNPIASIEVEEVMNIELGKANQKIGDITITESVEESFLDGPADIVLDLDPGYRFAEAPEVEVVEGDLDIDEDVSVNGGRLTIQVDSQSNKTPGKIVISDIYLDAYRTAPEGPINIEFASQVNGGTATCEIAAAPFNRKSPGKAVIANCVTAALGETLGNGQFVISSNIYEMNGVKKVMDAAPYIKNDRTYVPVRFLSYVLGLTDDDIIWDEASQKVTLTLDDTVVELTIGSTAMYVNGEAVQMDVAPEITDDRTFLPARWVAEAFGFKVGWDGATRTVLISK